MRVAIMFASLTIVAGACVAQLDQLGDDTRPDPMSPPGGMLLPGGPDGRPPVVLPEACNPASDPPTTSLNELCTLQSQGRSASFSYDAKAIDEIEVRGAGGSSMVFPLEAYVARVLWCEFHSPWRDPVSYRGVEFPDDRRTSCDGDRACIDTLERELPELREALDAAATIIRTYATTAVAVNGYIVNSQGAGGSDYAQVNFAGHCPMGEPVPAMFVDAVMRTSGQRVIARLDEGRVSLTPFYRNAFSYPESADGCVASGNPGSGKVPNPEGAPSPQGYSGNLTNRGTADQQMLMCLGTVGFETHDLHNYFFGDATQIVSCDRAALDRNFALGGEWGDPATAERSQYAAYDADGVLIGEGSVRDGYVSASASSIAWLRVESTAGMIHEGPCGALETTTGAGCCDLMLADPD